MEPCSEREREDQEVSEATDCQESTGKTRYSLKRDLAK